VWRRWWEEYLTLRKRVSSASSARRANVGWSAGYKPKRRPRRRKPSRRCLSEALVKPHQELVRVRVRVSVSF